MRHDEALSPLRGEVARSPSVGSGHVVVTITWSLTSDEDSMKAARQFESKSHVTQTPMPKLDIDTAI